MTKTPRERLPRLADRYWSNPDVRLAKTNDKRRRRGLPERRSTAEIEASPDVARRLNRNADGTFTMTLSQHSAVQTEPGGSR